MSALFVYVTTPNKETARNLARDAVSARLCSGVNIIDGMESFYWWKGNLENAQECVLIFKTTKERYPDLERQIRERHPYETPCIVAWPVDYGHEAFLQWIEDETRR